MDSLRVNLSSVAFYQLYFWYIMKMIITTGTIDITKMPIVNVLMTTIQKALSIYKHPYVM